MPAFAIRQILGGLVSTFLLSRFLLWILKSWPAKYRKLIFANVISLLLATLFAGMGMADEGAFAAVKAFGLYFISQSIVLAIDLLYTYFAKPKIEEIGIAEKGTGPSI